MLSFASVNKQTQQSLRTTTQWTSLTFASGRAYEGSPVDFAAANTCLKKAADAWSQNRRMSAFRV